MCVGCKLNGAFNTKFTKTWQRAISDLFGWGGGAVCGLTEL